MSDPVAEAARTLFERAPDPTIIYDRAAVTARANRAARALLEGDDGRTGALLAAFAADAALENEPLRRPRMTLPHLPGRSFQARALPLDERHTAVLLEDTTESLARRDALSVHTDLLDRLDAAFIVCAAPRGQRDPRRLPIIASNARARVLAGVDRFPSGMPLGDALDGLFSEPDLERLTGLLVQTGAAERSVSWRIEQAERVWSCRAWLVGYRLGIQIDDISEKGHLAQALSEHARLLRAANDETDEVTFILREHLREPLRETARLIDRLADEAESPELAEQHLSRLTRIHGQVARTVDDLLGYIAIARTPLTGGTVDLDRLLRHIVAALAPRLREQRAAVEHDALPTVWGQERLLETLLTQLVLDGLAPHRRRAAPYLYFETTRVDGAWRVTMRDNRVHADVEFADSLLRLGKPTQGMGLAICRRIVEHHGGTMGVETDDGSTAVWFELPSVRGMR